jgi:hypothetical protein
MLLRVGLIVLGLNRGCHTYHAKVTGSRDFFAKKGTKANGARSKGTMSRIEVKEPRISPDSSNYN